MRSTKLVLSLLSINQRLFQLYSFQTSWVIAKWFSTQEFMRPYMWLWIEYFNKNFFPTLRNVKNCCHYRFSTITRNLRPARRYFVRFELGSSYQPVNEHNQQQTYFTTKIILKSKDWLKYASPLIMLEGTAFGQWIFLKIALKLWKT